MKAVVVGGDAVTAYGWGVEVLWRGLVAGTSAIGKLNRFCADSFQSQNAATIGGINPSQDQTMVLQMLHPLIAASRSDVPHDACLLLATTVGEIELLERAVEAGAAGGAEASCPNELYRKLAGAWGLAADGLTISAACASSTIAIAHAASLIRSGRRDAVLVAACDAVSEFVFSGFSSLLALDPDVARPFDRERAGLTLGEAAGYVLMMSEQRAAREGRTILGEVAGWGLTSDANHMTGPLRDGAGVARSLLKALATASIEPGQTASIVAHGTGTLYNDSMEMKAFKAVFEGRSIPTYSIKGGTGHTLGATGLVEVLVGLRSARELLAPPSVNLRECDEEAAGWVNPRCMPLGSGYVVSTNAGFGGINAALVLRG